MADYSRRREMSSYNPIGWVGAGAVVAAIFAFLCWPELVWKGALHWGGPWGWIFTFLWWGLLLLWPFIVVLCQPVTEEEIQEGARQVGERVKDNQERKRAGLSKEQWQAKKEADEARAKADKLAADLEATLAELKAQVRIRR